MLSFKKYQKTDTNSYLAVLTKIKKIKIPVMLSCSPDKNNNQKIKKAVMVSYKNNLKTKTNICHAVLTKNRKK